MFFSQQGEDVYILKNFINKPTDTGRFVEVGALDGVTYSNTLFFEGALGFTGVLIEPSKHFEGLQRSRPNCTLVNKAISDAYGTVVFRDDWAMSGILNKLPEVHTSKNFHGNGDCYDVETVMLGPLLKESNTEYVDLLFIDVEGGELEVMKSMDWTIPVYVICIELDGHNSHKDERCRRILRKEGFEFDTRISVNEFWVNKGYFRKDLLFDEQSLAAKWSTCSSLGDIGQFMCLEPHLVEEVQRVILG